MRRGRAMSHWIDSNCHPDREGIMEPFGAVLFGVRHRVATNGWSLLAVPQDDAPAGNERAPKNAEKIFPTTPIDSTIETTVHMLREWALDGLPEKCPSCRGLGDCQCRCGHEHDCGRCDGTGYADRETRGGSKLCGKIGAVVFHRERLADMLAAAPDGPVMLATRAHDEPISLTGAGWIGLLMGIRHNDEERDGAKVWP